MFPCNAGEAGSIVDFVREPTRQIQWWRSPKSSERLSFYNPRQGAPARPGLTKNFLLNRRKAAVDAIETIQQVGVYFV